MEENWKIICQYSLFSNRIEQLDNICQKYYAGVSFRFVQEYLQPVVELIDSLRITLEEYYCTNSLKPHPWLQRFENIIRYAIHPYEINADIFPGDFCVYIAETSPRTLLLRYYLNGIYKTITLSSADCVLMVSENWIEMLNITDNCNYLKCIIWNQNDFERISWDKLLSMHNEESSPVHSKSLSIELWNEGSLSAWMVLDVNFELLHNQVAYLPGSRDKRGGSVIFFDTSETSWENIKADSEEFAKLLMYYYKIPRESVQKKGLSLVIDARQMNNAQTIIECIGKAISTLQRNLPGAVYMTYLLLPKDSLMLLVPLSKIKESLNFEFQLISSLEKLHNEIDKSNLPIVFGGTLEYDHQKWIKFRTQVEPFMVGCRSAAKYAINLMSNLNKSDPIYSKEDFLKLLELHKEKSNEILCNSRLIHLQQEGIQIISWWKNCEDQNMKTEDFIDTIDCVKQLYSQVNLLFNRLQLNMNKRQEKIELYLKTSLFEETSQKITTWIQKDAFLILEQPNEIGDSIGHAQSLMSEFSKFSQLSEENIQCAEENIILGNQLLKLPVLKDIHESIKDTLVTLEKYLKDFILKYSERKKKLTKSLDFHTLVLEAHQWWMTGLQYIAHMNMEEIQTHEGIAHLKNSLCHFIKENPFLKESQIARITELAHHLGSKYVEQAEQNSKRCLEVQEMLQVKQNQIAGAEERLKRNWDQYSSDPDNENSSGIKDDDVSTEADEDLYQDAKSVSDCFDLVNFPVYSWQGSQYDENDANLAVFDAAMPFKMKERLRFIIEEMINTEYQYVHSLEYVLVNYLPEMDSDHLPPTLKGRKNILFGNIDRIYEFHKRHFSHDIESYRHAPLQIGKCFLKWERQFYVYAQYNKNKPKSDEIWNDFANVYFEAKMKQLNDKLDLASYLIKPVQRLGKYSLLLRDMISCCDPKDPRVSEMKMAHELMKFQLRHGNDLLAMDAIRNADVNLKEEGCLLRQADFIVWYGKRKRLRRVFLFEHSIVFTKAKEQKAHGDHFIYKHSIKTVDLGLTANIGDSGLKFEVWYRRWKKGRTSDAYILQATTEEIKAAWTSDITRILWRQATRNKEYGLTEVSTGISVESTPSAIFPDSGVQLNSYSRQREISPRSLDININKRLSWVSAGDSSGSSGVHDLGSLPEDPPCISPRDEKNYCKRAEGSSKSSSTQRKFSQQFNLPLTYNEADITFRRDQSNVYDGFFIRNNVFRKTIQYDGTPALDRTKTGLTKKIYKKYSSGKPRFATQPIILPSNFSEVYKKTNTVKYRKVLSERPTSPESIVECVEEDTLANKLNSLLIGNDTNNTSIKKPISPMLCKKAYTQGDLSIYKDFPQTYCFDNTKPLKQYSYFQSKTPMAEGSNKFLNLQSLSCDPLHSCSTNISENLRLKSPNKSISLSTTTFFTSKDSKKQTMLPTFLRKRLSKSFTDLL
ncbi:puratrophin-1 isoform X5 [Hydra vulgaris]|uniref:Puratrophin-1 isoform X5 n=1 Tax=Hydra vulgaris TaxID=6087 RepID=A0ABM4DB52_HYDVU